MSITIDAKNVGRLFKVITNWTINGVVKDMNNASKEIAEKYKKQIKAGKNGDNSSMPNVKDVTMTRPIRYGSDPAIRGEVRSSKTPLYARGRAVNSIKSKRINNTFEIGPSSNHGDLIFGHNATSAKTKRDPLIVSDVQMDIIEDHIEKGLNKILDKF